MRFVHFLLTLLTTSALMATETTLQVDPNHVLATGVARKFGINITDFVDNDRDWRPAAPRSTLDALVAMRVTSLRTGADEFIWSRPPYDRPQWTWARPGPEDWLADTPQFSDDDKETVLVSGVDVDLLADWCRALGAEATIIVPFDSMVEYKPASPYGKAPTADELITAATALVRYCNVTRKYGFKYWELGNESELNGMPSDLYVAQARRFYSSMKEIDPTIRIGVCADKQLEKWLQPLFIKRAPPYDFLSIHEYPCWEWGSYDFYRTSTPDLTGKLQTCARFLDQRVADRKDVVGICVTEINSWDWSKKWPEHNTHGHALVTAEILGRHLVDPRCTLAQLWATRYFFNLIPGSKPGLGDALAPDNSAQPSGQVMELWGQTLLDEAVAVQGETVAVRAFALRDAQRLHLLVINKEPTTAAVRVTFAVAPPGATAARWTMAGTDPETTTSTLVVGKPVALVDGALAVELPPFSATLLAFVAPPDPASSVVLAATGAPRIEEAGPDRIVLTWKPSGGAWTYEILRDGALVGTSVRPWFADRRVTAGTAVRYTVRARDRAGTASEPSPALAIAVPPDVTPPRLLRVLNCGLADRLDLVFDEPVDPASAADPAAFAIAGAIVRSADVTGDGTRVVLRIDPLADGVELAIRAPGVRDRAGNPTGVAPAVTHRFLRNLFYNPGFEEPNRQWSRWDQKSTIRFDHPQHHGGKRAMHVPPEQGGGHNRRADRFLPGRTYHLRWFAKTTVGKQAWFGVKVLDFQFGNALIEKKVEMSGGDWTRYETTFVMPERAQQMNFWVWSDKGCEMWLDDIELVLTEDAVTPAP